MFHDDDYFKAEEKSGFFVSSLMKRCWAAQLEVLESFGEICSRNGLRYYLADGTLLGAVRHKGFIPWDDDIDIWMLRQDLDRLIREAQEDIREKGLELVTPFSDKDYNNLAFRIINTRMPCIDPVFLEKYHYFPFMAGLDIFPLDYVPREEADFNLLRTLMVSANLLGDQWRDESVSKDEKMELYRELVGILGVSCEKEELIENQLWKLADRIGAMYNEGEADTVAALGYLFSDPQRQFPKEWFAEPVYLEFEGLDLPCPQEPQEVLKRVFGEDYMIPQRIEAAHGYPYYRQSHQILMDYFERLGIACPAIYRDL